jgi:hypothetical protein
MQMGFIGDEMNPAQIMANAGENAQISQKRIPFPLCSTTACVESDRGLDASGPTYCCAPNAY